MVCACVCVCVCVCVWCVWCVCVCYVRSSCTVYTHHSCGTVWDSYHINLFPAPLCSKGEHSKEMHESGSQLIHTRMDAHTHTHTHKFDYSCPIIGSIRSRSLMPLMSNAPLPQQRSVCVCVWCDLQCSPPHL